ncbi:hypothetical protein CDL15_Pgr029201 [Punica granatum]|uniref:Retrotransposon gag domain-containing protein n=1 Tax=Punica granatum TaxID=22663 RepID=A0A218XDM8_PUNGR|nr:hypothetical protein CDL15_Pgr029201 [Punica granatum]
MARDGSTVPHSILQDEPKVSLADLSRLVQQPGETVEAYIARFKKARHRYSVALFEAEFVKLALTGLNFELHKKFEGIDFEDFFELSTKVARYENLLREEAQEKRASSMGTYYHEANLDVAVVEMVSRKPMTCLSLVKVDSQPENIKRHPYESNNEYSFDLSRLDDIFDFLLIAGHIKLLAGHRMPSAEELKNREYCKYHNSCSHATVD